MKNEKNGNFLCIILFFLYEFQYICGGSERPQNDEKQLFTKRDKKKSKTFHPPLIHI